MEKRNINKVCAIFFDLDNTLIETRKADEQTCNKLLEILYKQFLLPRDSAKEICNKYLKLFRKCPENCSMGLHEWRQLLWAKALGENHQHLANDIYVRWLELRYKYLSIKAEIRSMLTFLSDKYLLALITNGTSNAQWEKIEKLNLKHFFDLILVSGDQPWEKPQPEIFLDACDNLGIEPHQVIMVGDKLETDILGGINSKLAANVWIPIEGQRLLDDDPAPDFILENVTELVYLMAKINKPENPMVNRLQVSDMEDCNSNGSDGS
ncbi:unnamed protein product [Phyllotreta striolata]|uniref:N-acylneuraminate-9-phosphatase n=1 Tax=Phyllotreta striolata TaxID=444603 RepID=A0A9N9TL18_PHYSR|nr:unnamed protein product [Phyllotreta striolata]